MSGRRFSRRRAVVISALAASLLSGGGMALVGGASAQPGGQPETGTVGRNWEADRQDAQPNYRAPEPAERGQRLTPEQRLEQVRPSGGTGAPERAPSGGALVPVTEEPAK